MLTPEPRSTPLADSSEDVLGLSLVRLMWARLVMVCHVGPGAGLVQLEQGNRVERGATPHAGSLAACSAMANIIYGDLADGGGVPTAMREFNFQTLHFVLLL